MSERLPWHRPTIERLAGLRDAGVLPNAIALTCPPGWGHAQLLEEAAMMLLEETAERQVEEFAHPDFRWIVPDGAVIKIDQVRRLNEFAVQTTQAAPRKVAAVLDAHLLNVQAANALLKTLEEPPPNTHLLLATPHWGKLLPTVRSRCQRFPVTPDSSLARTWLHDNGVDLSAAEFAEFGYAPLTALAQHQDAMIDLTDWLEKLPAGKLAAAVDPVLDLDVVSWLSRWYRRVLLHLRAEPIPGCTASAAQLIEFADEVLSLRRQIESTNSANTRLLLERLVVRWVQIQRRARG